MKKMVFVKWVLLLSVMIIGGFSLAGQAFADRISEGFVADGSSNYNADCIGYSGPNKCVVNDAGGEILCLDSGNNLTQSPLSVAGSGQVCNCTVAQGGQGHPYAYVPVSTAGCNLGAASSARFYFNTGGSSEGGCYCPAVGVCGSATNPPGSVNTPSSNLCSSGTASAVTDGGSTWNWTCSGTNCSTANIECTSNSDCSGGKVCSASNSCIDPPPSCPTGESVSLLTPVVRTGGQTRVYAPSSYYSSGEFLSSNNNVASLGSYNLDSTSGWPIAFTDIYAHNAGTTNIDGAGWTYTGASPQPTACTLDAQTLTVENFYCIADSECDDSNACTVDTCEGAGTPGAFCSYSTPGTHNACTALNTCSAVANTASVCSDACADNSACGTLPKPHIVLTPTSMYFQSMVGGGAPQQFLNVSNTGDAALNFTATSNFLGKNGTWCHSSIETTGAFNLPAHTSTNIGITVDPRPYADTWNDCGIRVADSNADNSPQDLDITFEALATVGTPPPNPPTNPGDCNSQTVCPYGGGTPACGYVRLVWTDNSTNESSFRIYRSLSSTYAGGASFQTVNSTTAGGTGQQYSLDINYGSDTTPYYYWVRAVGLVDSAESRPPTPFNSIANFNCSARLDNSDKEITSVNSTPVSPAGSVCDNQSQGLPTSIQLQSYDILTFAINACNDSGSSDATNIFITDHLGNYLKQPSGPNGFNPCYFDTGSTCQVADKLSYQGTNCTPTTGRYCYNNASSDPTLTFNLSGASKDVPAGGRKTLTFQAQLVPTAGSASTFFRFQNSALVGFDGSTGKWVRTQLELFINGDNVPGRTEF